MKKILSISSFVIFVLAIIISSFIVTDIRDKNNQVTVRYLSTEGGKIKGETTQTVHKGMNTETVVAIPDEGYYFAYWDDNSGCSAQRTDINVKEDITVTAVFENITFNVNYYAGEHGRIEGEPKQTVIYGNDSKKVTAIADEGYEFSGWSDGIKTAERQDSLIMQDINVTACFGKIEKVFALNYNFGKTEENITEILLDYDNLDTTKLPVPTREHFTFGGWYLSDLKITDASGKITVGDELFDEEGTEIYAKWTANETFTYKILMIYVTEVDAQIPTRLGDRIIDVDYKMSEFERAICKELTHQVKSNLDDMLDGLVEFIVDEYFTTVPINTEDISRGGIAPGEFSCSVDPRNIKEVENLFDHYQSVFSVFSFNDFDYQMHNASGSARAKYGKIHFDSMLDGLYSQNSRIWGIDNIHIWNWTGYYDTVIHELIHTIEMKIDTSNSGNSTYHAVLSKHIREGIYDIYLIEKKFLLNEAILNDKKVGIPYDFWGLDEIE